MSAKHSLLDTLRRVWLGLFAVFAVALIIFVLVDSHARLPELTIRQPEWLALGVAAHIIFWFLATKFWAIVVATITGTRMKDEESFKLLAMVAVGKYLPGKIWGFVARGSAMKQSNTSTQDVVATALLEQWTMLMSALLVSSIAALIVHTNHAVVTIALVGAMAPLVGHKLFAYCMPALRWLFNHTPKQTAQAVIPLTMGRYVHLLTLHTIMWCMLGGVLAGIHFSISDTGFIASQLVALILANTVAIVVGFAALFAPGGIGVREVVTAVLLLPFLQPEQAAVAAVAFRLWTTIVDLALGLFIFKQSRTQLASIKK